MRLRRELGPNQARFDRTGRRKVHPGNERRMRPLRQLGEGGAQLFAKVANQRDRLPGRVVRSAGGE